MSARYPLYGQVVSIGGYSIPASCGSYLEDDPYVYTPSQVYFTGNQYPQDGYSGGAAPLNSQMVWSLAIRPPAGTDATVKAIWCEGVWEAIRTAIDTPNDDGSTGRNFVLTVRMADGSAVSAPCELIGIPQKSADRHQGQVVVVLLTVQLHGPFQ